MDETLELFEDTVRHALLRLELGQVAECETFLRECLKRFPPRPLPSEGKEND